MIVSSGYNIGGPEVEAAIDQHPDVVESAVVGRPDPERGSVVCAFVVLRDGVVGRRREGARRSRTSSRHASPRTSTRATSGSSTELPRNPSGKLQHFELRETVTAPTDLADAGPVLNPA